MERDKKKMPPIKVMPYDPENIKLSKSQFVDKQRRLKEEDEAVREFKEKRKREASGGVQEEESKEEVTADEAPKRGRPKKVD